MSEEPKEQWSWIKWIKGHISITRYGKDIGTIIRIAIIIVLGFALFLGVAAIKNKLFPKKSASESKHVDKSTIASNEGTITQEDSHETVNVVHNHSPLEGGLLGLVFGSKDQTVREDNCSNSPPNAKIEVKRV